MRVNPYLADTPFEEQCQISQPLQDSSELDSLVIEGKSKLSQNREPRDRINAADTLLAKGDKGMGEAMRSATKELR